MSDLLARLGDFVNADFIPQSNPFQNTAEWREGFD
jgi:hypothetical protein